MSLSLEDIDARIASLQAEIDTTGSSLAALDGDITLKLLTSAKLSGRTAAEWNAVSPDIPLLWGYYGVLKDKVAEVVALRGTKARLRTEHVAEPSARPPAAARRGGDAVACEVEPATGGLRAAVAARGELAGQLTAAAEALGAIGTLIDQARAARAEASQKILGITNGAVDADALAARLTFLGTNLRSITSVGQGDWQEARRVLCPLDQ